MANVEITDGTSLSAGISDDKELQVITAPYPPFKAQKVQPFRQYFTADGTATGSNDMGVTSGEFYIPADPSSDRYVTTVNFIVGYGSSAQPYQWADGTAMSAGTGIRLYYSSLRGEFDIHDDIKSNQDLLNLSFNAVTSAWQVRGVQSLNDYGYFVSVDLTKMGLPFGVKLDAGTTQKVTLEIRSASTATADLFTATGFGFERFK